MNLDQIAEPPAYNQPEDHKDNLKCLNDSCNHPQRSHKGEKPRLCLMAACPCSSFETAP